MITIAGAGSNIGTLDFDGKNVTINSTGAQPVTINGTITTTGNQNYNGTGGIRAGTSGTIRMESGNNITIATPVTNTTQLIAISTNTTAPGGVVTFGNVNTSNNSTSHSTGASIYVKAYDFTASGTGVTITPGTGGQLCLELGHPSRNNSSYDGRVAGNRYHVHGLGEAPEPPQPSRHLVYYSGTQPTGFTPAADYNFVPSTSTETAFFVDPDKNIFIINVGTHTRSLTFTVSNDTNRTGYIEFRGIYESSGTLTLTAGSGGIRLNNATVTLSAANSSLNIGGSPPLTLAGTPNTLAAGTVTLGAITGGGNSLAITGNAVFNGAATGIATLSVSGTSTIGANITTTGNQTYTGAVTLTGAAVTRTLAGTTVTMGAINGGGNSLTITGAAVFNGAANTGIAVLSVSGLSTISGNITTTGNQSYAAVNLGASSRTLTSTGGSVAASGAVTGNTGIEVHASQGIELNNAANTLTGNIMLWNNEGATQSGAVSFRRNNSTNNITVRGANPATGASPNGNFTVVNNGGNISVSSLRIEAAGTVTLTSSGEISQAGAITAASLAATASGGIGLNSSNVISSGAVLNNSTAGNINLTNTSTGGTFTLTANNTATGTIGISRTGAMSVTSASAGGNITLSTTGTGNNLTQTGAITTTGTLIVSSDAAITLNNTANNAATLNATASGAVQFTNSASFSVAALSAAGNAEMTANAGNITISGAVSSSTLSLTATAAAAGTVSIDNTITVSGGGDQLHNVANSGVLIRANSLTGSGDIDLNPTSTVGWVCVYIANSISYTGTVTDNRIHYHTASGRHIVYRPEADAGSYTGIAANSYTYIRADDNLGAAVRYETTGNGNIYIIDVGNSVNANTRAATFSTAAGGYIEFRGAYQSSGALTLNAGTTAGTNIRLGENAAVTLTGAGNNFNIGSQQLTLAGAGNSNTIEAATVTVGAITGGGNSLTITGNAVFNGAATGIAALIVNGTSSIGANITTTTGGQTYNGAVTLTGANRTFTGNAGSLVRFQSTVNGAFGLTVETANAQFDGIVGGTTALTSVSVNTGTSAINANITTTGTPDTQRYTGAVTLGADVNLTAPAGSLVRFGSTVNNAGGAGSTARALTVTTANVQFSGAVGGTAANTALASVNVTAGTSTINGNVRTTGAQTYTGAVTLTGANRTFTGNAGSLVRFQSTVNGAFGLTVETANAQFDGVVGGTTALTSVSVNTGTSAINANITTTAAQTYMGAVTLGANVDFNANTGTVRFGNTVNGDTNTRTLTVTTANARFDGVVGGVTALASVNVTAGTSAIYADITTTGNQTYTGAVTLNANVNLTGGSSSTVLFSNTVNGDNNTRTLTVTTANVHFSNTIGNTTALASVNVTAGTSRIDANVRTTGAQTYTGAVTLGANITFTAPAGSLVTFGNTVRSNDTTARSLTVTTANVQFNGDVGIASNPISTVSIAGTSRINANITTTGTPDTQTFTGAVTLGADVNLTAPAGSLVTFGNTVTGAFGLTVMTANVRFDGAVTALTSVNVTAGSSAVDADITTSGNQTYVGTVNVNGLRTLISTGGSISTTGLVTAAGGVNIEAETGITIGSGGINSSSTQTGVIKMESAGNIALNGPVYGSQLIAITSGDVTFSSTVAVSSTVNNSGADPLPSGPGNLNNAEENAPIYVRAYDFTPSGGANSITPGPNGHLCLELGNLSGYTSGIFNGIVTGDRYHIHGVAPPSKHLVYYTGAAPTGVFMPNIDYDFVSSSGLEIAFSVAHDKNIYIYNVGTTAHSLTFTVSSGSPHTGFIRIYGSYTAPGLTLNPGTGGVELYDNANINLSTGGFSTNSEKLTLDITNNDTPLPPYPRITAQSITLGNIEGTGRDLTLNAAGAINITGTIAALGSVTVTNGNVALTAAGINAASYTQSGGSFNSGTGKTITTTGNISFSSTALNSGTLTLTAGAGGNVSLTGITGSGNLAVTNAAAVTIAGAGTAGSRFGSITVDNAGTAGVTFSANVFAASVNINGNVPSTIGANINTSGAQNYTGAVTLTGNRTFTADSGSLVTFGSTVNGNTNTRTLTVTTADVRFDGAVGGGTGLASVTVNAGSSTINANIYTTGNQSYAAVALGSTLRTLTSSGGSVTAAGVVSGTAGITVNASQGITMNAANTLSGTVTLDNNQGTTRSGNVSYTGNGAVTVTGRNTAGSPNGNFTVNAGGAITVADTTGFGGISATGTVTLSSTGGAVSQNTSAIITAANLAATAQGGITLTQANVVSSGAVLNNTAGTPTGNISFTNASTALNLTANNPVAAGTITVNQTGALSVASASTPTGGSISLTTTTGAGRNITQTGTITTGALTVSSGGAVTLTNAANNVATLNVTAAAGAVQFTNAAALAVAGVSGVGGNNVTITTAGAASHVTQTVTVPITTTGTLTVHSGGAVTLNSANAVGTLAVTGAGGAVQFTNAEALIVAGVSGVGSNNVEIITTTGATNHITQTGAVTTTGTLTVSSSGAITLTNTANAAGTLAVTAAGGAVQFTNASALAVAGVSVGSNNVTITTASGNITQTGAITTGTLFLNSGGAITLNGANAVGTLNVTHAAGAVQFTNAAALTVAGVNGVSSHNVKIETTSGNITQSGTITTGGTLDIASAGSVTIDGSIGNGSGSSAGAVTLSSGTNQNVTISGTIHSYSLALTAAGTGTVTIGGTGDRITVSSSNATSHEANAAAVHIRAGNIAGNGGINLTSTGWVCAYIDSAMGYTGTVTDNRIHYHITPGKHIVYRALPPATFTPSFPIPEGYLYYQADSNLGAEVFFNTAGSGNVYIIDVGNVSPANTRKVNVSTEAGGHIEIWGAYTSSGALTLSAGTAGIRLDSAVINLTGEDNNFNIGNQPLTLAGTTNSITAAAVTMGAVTGAGSFTINGNAVFNGTPNSVSGITSLTVNGTSTINGNITTTNNQEYTGAVTLGGTGRAFTSSGGSVTVNGHVSGSGITVNASTGISIGTAADRNHVNGNVTLNNTGTASENISFFNNSTSITLTANNGSASGTITVDETGSLTIGSGGVTSSAGAVNLVGTTGINVIGPVDTGSTGAAINLMSTGGAVSGAGLLTGTNLTVNAGSGISLTSANNAADVSFTNGTTGGILYKSGHASELTITSAVNNAASGGTIDIEAAGNLTIANTVNPAVSTGTSQGAVNLKAAGDITVTGNIGSSGNGTVTLTSGDNKDITINGAINCYSLALIAGGNSHATETETKGTVTIAAGSSITAASTGQTHTQTSSVYVWAGTLKGSGSITLPASGGWVCVWFFEEYDFEGNVTGSSNPGIIHTHAGRGRSIVYSIGSRANFISTANPSVTEDFVYYRAELPLGSSISAEASGSGNIYIVDIVNGTSGNDHANTRSIAFTTQNGFIEIRGDYYSSGTLTLNSGSGAIQLRNANINLSGAPFNTNGASLSLQSAANNIAASAMTLNSVEGSANSLTLFSAGSISVNGAVGSSASPVGDITVLDGGVTFSGSSPVSAANFRQDAGTAVINAVQNYTGAFAFNSAETLAVNNTSITATGAITVSGEAALSGNVALNSGGNITLAEVTGSSDLTINNGGQYTQNSALTANSFRQTGGGAVSLNADITVTAAGMAAAVISFNRQAVFTNALTFAVPSTGGIVDLSQGVDGSFALTLSGGSFDSESAYLQLSKETGFKGDVIVSAASHVKVNSGNTINQADGKTLTLQGNSALDTSAGSWHMGSSSSSNDFAGVNGTLKLDAGSRLTAGALNLTGNSFAVDNTGWAYINVKGSVVIGADVTFTGDHPQLVLEMTGSGAQSLTARQAIGSLFVKAGSSTNLAADLNIRGRVVIEYSRTKPSSPSQQPPGPHGVLNAGSFNLELYAGLDRNGTSKYGRWEIINAHENISSQSAVHNQMNAFLQDAGGTVEFKRDPSSSSSEPLFFEIIGNTVWQKFVSKEGGTTFQFSMHPDQHAFLNTFDVSGMIGNHITLTRYIDPDDPAKSQWEDYYDGSRIPPSDANPSVQDNYGLPRVPASRNLKTGDESELEKFWNFNLVSSSSDHRLMDISNLTIFFSHAWHQRVPIASEPMGLRAVPFFRVKADGSREGYFNYDWIEVRKIIYSFVEDGNGNGKLDRIRVQTNVPLNGDFEKFNVEVEGYRVDTGRGNNGFDVVEHVVEKKEGLDVASFYIYLEEGPYLYDGKSVHWWVTRNESLMDYATQTMPVGEAVTGDPQTDESFSTINTIPPRVSFALTLPGHNQTYVRMSQPVSGDAGASITGKGVTDSTGLDITPSSILELNYYPFDSTPVPYPVAVPEGVSNYLLDLDYTPAVSDLANFPPIGNDPGEYNFTFDGIFKDLGVRALDWNDPLVDETAYIYYPSPRYPLDWNYSGYDEYTGNEHISGLSDDADRSSRPEVFLPPNRMLTPEMIKRLQEYAASAGKSASKLKPEDFNDAGLSYKRRITDLLVSMTPTNTDSENYFAWPVWARYKDTSRHQSLNPDSNFWGQQNTDDGIIWTFDGTKFLEERDITLQARINNKELEGFSGMSLFYGVDVPVQWRDPAEAGARGKAPGGLWLPGLSLDVNPLYNIVPSRTKDMEKGLLTFYPANQKSPVSSFAPLFTFDIEKADGGSFSSGVKLDFLLRLDKPGVDPNLFVARFEAPSGADLRNLEWWTMVRPFSFDLQNIRLQRGGVTILNNVINSNNREITYIRYHLVRPGRVTIQVYTLDGTLVKSIRRNEQRDAGEWTDVWDGTNNGRRAVARGMYFVRVVGPDIDEIRKVMVIK